MEKNFTNYDSVDFAQEPSFIRWVKKGDEASAKFWKEWQSTHPNKSKLIEEARRMVLAIRFKEEEVTQTQVDSLWGKIDLGIDEGKDSSQLAVDSSQLAVDSSQLAVDSSQLAVDSSQSAVRSKESGAMIREMKPVAKRRTLLRAIGSVAAVGILLLGFWFFYNPDTNVNVVSGQLLAYDLPDESRVQLNALSTIHYKERTWEKNRTIYLEGEAFFEVEKGSKFTVVTQAGNVEVLGTSFNVYARAGELKVECFTGKVKVSKNNEEVILTKGLATSIEESKPSKPEPINLEEAATWRTGEFEWSDVPLNIVFEELERQFDVRLKVPSSINNKVGNYFFLTKDGLETSLDKICTPNQLNWEKQGTVITISE